MSSSSKIILIESTHGIVSFLELRGHLQDFDLRVDGAGMELRKCI